MTSDLRAGAHLEIGEIPVTLRDLRENGWIAGPFTLTGAAGWEDVYIVSDDQRSNASGETGSRLHNRS